MRNMESEIKGINFISGRLHEFIGYTMLSDDCSSYMTFDNIIN